MLLHIRQAAISGFLSKGKAQAASCCRYSAASFKANEPDSGKYRQEPILVSHRLNPGEQNGGGWTSGGIKSRGKKYQAHT